MWYILLTAGLYTQRDRVKEKRPAWKLGEPGTLQQVPHVAVVRPVVEQGPGQLQQKPFCDYDPDEVKTLAKVNLIR